MRVQLWGTRGSLAAPGTETARFGGNTSCVEVRESGGTTLVLDAGTGIRRLGAARRGVLSRRHVPLSHLHMDHIRGFGFFDPLFDPKVETHLWGPASTVADLRNRLARYLSPPLSTRPSTPCPASPSRWANFRVLADRVCHPGFTVGYRIEDQHGVLAYLSDHEPALGVAGFPPAEDWTSGYTLARGANLLLHDAQYTPIRAGGTVRSSTRWRSLASRRCATRRRSTITPGARTTTSIA